MSGYTYSQEEDNLILEWIIKTDLFYELRTKVFWVDLSNSGAFEGRSWQSLENRFTEGILPYINKHNYNISSFDKRKILLAYKQTSNKFNWDDPEPEMENNNDVEHEIDNNLDTDDSTDIEDNNEEEHETGDNLNDSTQMECTDGVEHDSEYNNIRKV